MLKLNLKINKYNNRSAVRKILYGKFPFVLYKEYITEACANGVIMKYDPKSDVGINLFFKGSYEQANIDYISSMIENTGHIIDVGANIGYNSICWSIMHPNIFIHSFEPGKETFDLLKFNTQKNKRDNIILVNAAVSDKSGTAVFYHCSDNAYSSLKDTKRKEIVATYEVKVLTIDEYVKANDLEQVSLLKIDVEGLEHNVIVGAKDTLISKKPIVFCEIYSGLNSNENPIETIDFMEATGYRSFIMKEGKLEEFQYHNDKYYNYLFIPIEKLKSDA